MTTRCRNGRTEEGGNGLNHFRFPRRLNGSQHQRWRCTESSAAWRSRQSGCWGQRPSSSRGLFHPWRCGSLPVSLCAQLKMTIRVTSQDGIDQQWKCRGKRNKRLGNSIRIARRWGNGPEKMSVISHVAESDRCWQHKKIGLFRNRFRRPLPPKAAALIVPLWASRLHGQVERTSNEITNDKAGNDIVLLLCLFANSWWFQFPDCWRSTVSLSCPSIFKWKNGSAPAGGSLATWNEIF